jgi:hypothetical protein
MAEARTGWWVQEGSRVIDGPYADKNAADRAALDHSLFSEVDDETVYGTVYADGRFERQVPS